MEDYQESQAFSSCDKLIMLLNLTLIDEI
jgi:hypothetical protein